MIRKRKMKKYIFSVLVLCMVAVLAACGNSDVAETKTNDDGYDIGFILDEPIIEDGSVNDAIWQGIISYGEEKGVAHKYFIPAECSTEGYLTCVEDAVESGVKIIVMKDGALSEAFKKAQKKYPDVKFMYIAGDFTEASEKLSDNSVCINFHEEQAGFIAGYATAMDNNTELGVVCEDDSEASLNYAYGFIQGVDEAAAATGLTDVSLTYYIAGDKVKNKAKKAGKVTDKMCGDGVKMVLASGGKSMTSEVCRSADQHRARVIGVNVDRSRISEKIAFSAVKDFSKTIKYGAELYYDDHFPGGKTIRLGTADEAVGIDLKTAGLGDFSSDDYEKLCNRLSDNVYKVRRASSKKSLSKIKTEIVQVSEY